MEYVFSPSAETVTWIMTFEQYIRIIILALGFISGTILANIFSSKWS